MKRLVLIIICFVFVVSCAGAQKSKNGKKAVKNKMRYLTTFVSEDAPPSPVCMVGYNREAQLHIVGMDFDGDNIADRVDYYNCNEYGKSPVVMEIHGSWRIDKSHTCRKVGFASMK